MYKNLNNKRKIVFFSSFFFVIIVNIVSFSSTTIDKQTTFDTRDIFLKEIIINSSHRKIGYSISIYSRSNQEFKIIAGYTTCSNKQELLSIPKGEVLKLKFLNYYDLRSLLNNYKETFGVEYKGKELISQDCITKESKSSKWELLLLSPFLLFLFLLFLNLGQNDNMLPK